MRERDPSFVCDRCELTWPGKDQQELTSGETVCPDCVNDEDTLASEADDNEDDGSDDADHDDWHGSTQRPWPVATETGAERARQILENADTALDEDELPDDIVDAVRYNMTHVATPRIEDSWVAVELNGGE